LCFPLLIGVLGCGGGIPCTQARCQAIRGESG
jgi:hypothetical protein